jgi:hypothetical protein
VKRPRADTRGRAHNEEQLLAYERSPEDAEAPFLPSTTPEVLRELAALLEAREPNRAGSERARRSLSPEALEELADMLLRRDRPTVGWWCRHLDKGAER